LSQAKRGLLAYNVHKLGVFHCRTLPQCVGRAPARLGSPASRNSFLIVLIDKLSACEISQCELNFMA
jgi:hypothetical protein